jgi:ABC-type transporter Mla MlaB component
MLRITKQQTAEKQMTLVLEGRLVGPWVAVLRQSCDEWAPHQLTVDLAEVSFADQAGLQLLKELQSSAIVLRNCSLFVCAQLKQPAPRRS